MWAKLLGLNCCWPASLSPFDVGPCLRLARQAWVKPGSPPLVAAALPPVVVLALRDRCLKAIGILSPSLSGRLLENGLEESRCWLRSCRLLSSPQLLSVTHPASQGYRSRALTVLVLSRCRLSRSRLNFKLRSPKSKLRSCGLGETTRIDTASGLATGCQKSCKSRIVVVLALRDRCLKAIGILSPSLSGRLLENGLEESRCWLRSCRLLSSPQLLSVTHPASQGYRSRALTVLVLSRCRLSRSRLNFKLRSPKSKLRSCGLGETTRIDTASGLATGCQKSCKSRIVKGDGRFQIGLGTVAMRCGVLE
ncbi:hypothetical protein V6N12_058220 [Hibiscus sabdariffa]|uniref:Uncharacterized protein n=1 Tax=Hibiscus sabdariffa TaxID=183260 RepID=A0ABR2ERJ7_9ROSI